MSTLAELLPYFAGLVVLLGLSAFFSGSETAIFSLTRTDAKRMDDGNRSERAVTELLRDPQRLLSTLLVGNMVVNVMLASVVGTIAGRFFEGDGWPIAIAITASTFLLLVFGEVTPKTIAVHHCRTWARLAARPLVWFSYEIRAVRAVLRLVTRLLLRICGQTNVQSWGTLTRDEILAALDAGQEAGVTSEPEHELVSHILRWEDVDAHDIMVPRTEVKGISDDMTLGEAFAEACRHRHSRLPIYHEDLDDIWGILLVSDLPRWRGTDAMQRTLTEFRPDSGLVTAATEHSPAFPVRLVPESAPLEKLLGRMQQMCAQLVVVVDEYGGTAGILTLEDVLEDIVGQLSPSEEDGHAQKVLADGDALLVDGRLHIREFNRESGFLLPKNGPDTVGGYVVELLGRLPRAGDTIDDDMGHHFRVIKMRGRLIGAVRVWRSGEATI